MQTPTQSRPELLARARWLEFLTVGWNLLEAALSIVAAVMSGSVAILSFGLDSVIETISGVALLWRLGNDDAEQRERAERRALKIVGASFFLLALYVTAESALALYRRDAPGHSWLGMAVSVGAIIVMPLLARAKRRVAVALSSGALHADSRQTDLCAYLSAITLGGLALNALLHWWWADPVAALLMVPIIANEGRQALRGEACGCADGCNAQPTVPRLE